MAGPLSFNRAQKSSFEAQERQAAALEQIVALLKAVCAHLEIKIPEPPALPPPEEPKVESFNPYTESAPGVALPEPEAQ